MSAAAAQHLDLAWALLAAGLLLSAVPDVTRQRLRGLAPRHRAVGVSPGAALRRGLRLFDGGPRRGDERSVGTKRAGESDGDDLRLAASWDLLAACLHAGMPVPAAVRAAAGAAPAAIDDVLLAAADLLALGADPTQAWERARACQRTSEFARAACRTARSGTALADVAAGLASRVRASAGDKAQARAQRAGVLMTGPLGLCFLPAFLCLGVIPVVLGLASQLTVMR